jgi:type I restriction enzyme S subunit
MAEGSLKLLRTTDITGGKVDWERVPFCSEEPPDAEHYRLAEGDIVVSRAGSVGASILLRSVPADAVFASYLVRLRPIAPMETRYVAYFLQSADYWAAIARRSAGIAIPNVNASKLATIEIPVAPLDEQRRIVARIEELFSDLDAGAASLDRVRLTLQRYLDSVLKAAVTGRLTEEWREGRPDVEPAWELLGRLETERGERRRDKHVPRVEPESLPTLPDGWCWASMDQLVARSEYGTSIKCGYGGGGQPVLRIPNISAGAVDLRDLKCASQQLRLADQAYLQPGDLLVCRTNGSVSLVGKCAVVERQLPSEHYFASYLLRLRFVETAITPRWVHACMASHTGRVFIEGHSASSAGQHNLSLSTLHSMPIRLLK